MGDGVNIAARLQSIAKPGAICLSEDAYRQVKARLDLPVSDLGAIQLKNIAEPVRVFSLQVGGSSTTKPTKHAAKTQRSIFLWAGTWIVALAVILGGAWLRRSGQPPAEAGSAAACSCVRFRLLGRRRDVRVVGLV